MPRRKPWPRNKKYQNVPPATAGGTFQHVKKRSQEGMGLRVAGGGSRGQGPPRMLSNALQALCCKACGLQCKRTLRRRRCGMQGLFRQAEPWRMGRFIRPAQVQPLGSPAARSTAGACPPAALEKALPRFGDHTPLQEKDGGASVLAPPSFCLFTCFSLQIVKHHCAFTRWLQGEQHSPACWPGTRKCTLQPPGPARQHRSACRESSSQGRLQPAGPAGVWTACGK